MPRTLTIIKFLLLATVSFLLLKFVFWVRLGSRHQPSETGADGTHRGEVHSVMPAALLRRDASRASGSASTSATKIAATAAISTSSPRTMRPDLFNSSSRIPQIFHQTFKSEMLYENYKEFISGCLSLNPNWTYYLWRDSDAEALIAKHYPEFHSKYKKYTDGLERSDSIRYIILHHFGGIYLDMDVECRQPFFPALYKYNSFLDQERIEQTNIHWGSPYSVMNSAMGSAPGHPFFRHMINEMNAVQSVGYAFSTTGPEMLTRVYKNYVASKPAVLIHLLEPKIMSPLMDKEKNWQQRCQGSLPGKSKPESHRSWKERGCLMLQAKNWRMDDTDASTVCIHRFLHLGYAFGAGARKQLFNATTYFGRRVHHYSQSDLKLA